MKKFVVLLFSIFCFSFVSNAQTIDKEELNQMREQMEGQMENMMKQLEQSFNMIEGSVTMMDTIMFKHFGTMGENGEFQPNEKMESMMKDMESMMQEAFGDMNLDEMMEGMPDFEESEEEGNNPKKKKQSRKSKKEAKKKVRKTSSL